METQNHKTQDQIVALLEAARTEIAAFRDEMANEKTDFTKRFEVLQAEIKSIIQEIRELNESNDAIDESEHLSIHSSTAALEKQVNTKGMIHDLKSSLDGLIDSLGTISSNIEKKMKPDQWGRLYDRLQRARIKLSILRLKLKLGKMTVVSSVIQKNKEFQDRVNQLKTALRNSEARAREGWQSLSTNVRDLYHQMHDTFTKD